MKLRKNVQDALVKNNTEKNKVNTSDGCVGKRRMKDTEAPEAARGEGEKRHNRHVTQRRQRPDTPGHATLQPRVTTPRHAEANLG